MSSIFPDIIRSNISYYTIPVAWVIALVPRFYGVALYQSHTKKSMDGRAPRNFTATVAASQALDEATKRRITRSEAAVANNLENLALFAAAVVAGNVAGLDAAVLNGTTLGYLAVRVLYNVIYVSNETAGLAALRSATFFVGLSLVMSLFVQAGNKLR